jgi:signal transduction histidine kinase
VRKIEEYEVHFSADTSLLLELGERLVSRPSIALAELVKNSYDADATKVTLQFQGVTCPGGRIVVEDNGEGMSFEVFNRAWMKIATDEKKRNPRSRRFRRVRTGSKGVGRFACQVLAKKLVLDSVANTDDRCERIHAEFDWERYKAGKDVTEIPIRCVREVLSEFSQTGMTLTLEDTRAPWSEEEFSDLRRDVTSLVTPFPWEHEAAKLRDVRRKDPGFDVRFDAPDFPEFEGPASRHILHHSWCSLKGHVDDKGLATYELRETLSGKVHTFTAMTRFSRLGEITFTIYYFVYKREYFPGVDIGLREMQRLGRRFGGVRVYLEDFRVFRYGEPGDDWLELEFDRSRRVTQMPKELASEAVTERAMLLLPGNNQLFGAVYLSRSSSPNIDLTITRDRLLDNEAFTELKRFIRLGINWMTVKYAAATAEARLKIRTKEEDPAALLEEAREGILQHERHLGSATGQIISLLDHAKNAVERQKEQLISDLAMLRVLASTGTMISIFEHELSLLLSDMRFLCSRLKEYSSLLPHPTKEKFNKTVSNLDEWINSLERESSLLGLLLGKEARQQRKAHVLRQIVEQLFEGFKHHLDDYGIETDADQISPSLRTPPMFLCEITSVFLNLMTNSIKKVKESSTRRIHVQASELNGKLEIRFLDSGPGVPRERRGEIFQPFKSTSEPDPIFGQGTGLGLSIVQDIIQDYNGKISFIDPPTGWGACVQILLPKEEKD